MHITPVCFATKPSCLRSIVFIAFFLLQLAGCASPYPYERFFPGVSPALGDVQNDHASIRVFYATDRRETGSERPQLRFGVERTAKLKLGEAVVTIPATHGRGFFEFPGVLAQPDPATQICLESIGKPTRFDAGFWNQVRSAVARSEKKDLLFYIHGYFTDFPTAVCRAAQIAHDVQLDGPVIAYSWSSQAFFWGYAADTANVEWTQPYLTRFLEALSRESGAEHIYLLAHSMGSKALVRAVADMDRGRFGPPGAKFDQVILAASDIDAEIFVRDYAPPLTRSARRATVYVSSNDWALRGAERLFGYKRLGQYWALHEAEDIIDASLDRIEVVDVTAHDKGSYGHIYYGSSPRVLDDLVGIFKGETPNQRGLVKENAHYALPLDAKPRLAPTTTSAPSEIQESPALEK